jgi:uracil-DNA glycosylase
MSLDEANAMDSSAEQSAGLQLNTRQRAMLEAMGITLWQSDALVDEQPLAQQNIAGKAIKNVANGAAAVARSPLVAADLAATAQGSGPAELALAPAPARSTAPGAASSITLQPLPQGIAQMDWQQLQNAVSTCQACALCAGRKNTVFGVGQRSTEPALAPRSDWLIVGEAPGENEDAQGEPFVGEAGKLLDNMLRAMLVDGQPLARQRNVFISNVLKCRPVADRNPSSAEVAMCQPYLQRQIALLQPKIILAMGRFAVQALIGSTEPLGKLRGRVHALQNSDYQAPVIVTYHPAYLLRNLPDKAKAWADLLLAMEALASSDARAG